MYSCLHVSATYHEPWSKLTGKIGECSKTLLGLQCWVVHSRGGISYIEGSITVPRPKMLTGLQAIDDAMDVFAPAGITSGDTESKDIHDNKSGTSATDVIDDVGTD
jgi:hypothetical protein